MKTPAKLALIVTIAALVGAGCWTGFHAWKSRQTTSALNQAKEFLRHGDFKRAAFSLATVPKSGRTRPEFLDIEARLYSASGNAAAAANDYSKIVTGEPQAPGSKTARVNLAQILMNSQVPTEYDKAARLLDGLDNDPQYGGSVTRIMAQKALQSGDVDGALRLAWKLGAAPNTPFSDRLLQLDIMLIGNSPLAESAIVSLEKSVSGNPANATTLARWLLIRKGAARAVAWMESLPENERSAPPLPMVQAECYSALKNWMALKTLLEGKNWGKFDVQREVYLAGAYRALHQNELAALSWQGALRDAKNHQGMPARLARAAVAEGRTDDAMEALWNVPANDPDHDWARGQLFASYRQRNDSANLIRLMSEALDLRPDNIGAKRSLASLLLITGRDKTRAMRLAWEVYERDSQSMQNVVLYAYSIYIKGDPARAAALIDAQSPEEKSSAECLPYYGVILAACGRDGEAQKCFANMDRKTLFPEMAVKIAGIEARWKTPPASTDNASAPLEKAADANASR